MPADLSHLLSVDKIKHNYEKTVKDIHNNTRFVALAPQVSRYLNEKVIGCVSENEMFPYWGELCKWERSYRAQSSPIFGSPLYCWLSN